MKATTRFRRMLREPGVIVAPGAYDCLSAKLIEAAGFNCCYMTGSGTAAARLGAPDVGLTTLSEMVGNARAIAQCIGIPLIADADTGFGNAINVIRTVREYENAGVAAIHIEDQVMPKKCGHFAGKELVSREEYIGKIRAAAEARRDPDFVIIARTDAIAVAGLDEAFVRAEAAYEAGAAVLFIESPESWDHVRAMCERFAGRAPLLANVGNNEGKMPLLTVPEAERLGYKIAIFPWAVGINVAAKAIADALAVLKETGSTEGLEDRQYGWRNLTTLLGLPQVYDLEQRYAVQV
ncbi:MAG: isocitrate lyase/PEP mutase family protein [Ardenticatenaceae bacterium]|nr:isocitrate lyase/PEP mutase family protein [Ardenticatenaceae bacterium]HBY95985.1 carboxyvinyl-carboxyphosphonate phosphorylmutase [Chloroflexota bacterium]